MLTARPASHSGNDACADAATASPHGVDTRACTALTVRAIVAMPLKSGSPASFITFDGLPPEVEHFAIRFAEAAENKVPLVRIHSECVTGDVFGSLRCDCGSPLEQSIEALQTCGGIVLYLRQEGRGIGLVAKLDAYRLQDRGLDTYAANRALPLPADAREYAYGANMLRAMGVQRIRLITNNPDKVAKLECAGFEVVECRCTGTFVTPFNRD